MFNIVAIWFIQRSIKFCNFTAKNTLSLYMFKRICMFATLNKNYEK